VRSINQKLSAARSDFPQVGNTEPIVTLADLTRFFYAEKKRDFSNYAKVEEFVKYAESFAGVGMNVPGRKAFIKANVNPTPVNSGAAKVVLMPVASVVGRNLPVTRRETQALEKQIAAQAKPFEDATRKLGGPAAMRDLLRREENELHPLESNATTPAQQQQYTKLGVLFVKMKESVEQYQAQLTDAQNSREGTTQIDQTYAAEMASHREELRSISDPMFGTLVRDLTWFSEKSVAQQGEWPLRNSANTEKQTAERFKYISVTMPLLAALRERLQNTAPQP
jgi:hypothetical protein